MNSAPDCRKYLILFVDGDGKTRKYFRQIFGATFRIVDAADASGAMELFEKHGDDIAVVVADQRMTRETSGDFLASLTQHAPEVVKILSTAYSDLDATIAAVTEGHIYHYLTKPWDVPLVEVILRRAVEFYHVKRERDLHLQTKLQAVSHVVMAGRLAAFALIPVATGVNSRWAAEAIATAVRLGSHGLEQSAGAEFPWHHAMLRQEQLARQVAASLPVALQVQGLASRRMALQQTLDAMGHGAWTLEGEVLQGPCNPFHGMLRGWIQGAPHGMAVEHAAGLLTGVLAVCDAGARVRCVRSEAPFAVKIAPVERTTSEVDEAVKWIFNDPYLIASAIGLDG